MRRPRLLAVPLVVASLVLAACSGGGGTTSAPAGPDPAAWRKDIKGSIEVGVIPAEGTPGRAYLQKNGRASCRERV